MSRTVECPKCGSDAELKEHRLGCRYIYWCPMCAENFHVLWTLILKYPVNADPIHHTYWNGTDVIYTCGQNETSFDRGTTTHKDVTCEACKEVLRK